MMTWLSLNIQVIVFEAHAVHPFSGRKNSCSNFVAWYRLSVESKAMDVILWHVDLLLGNDCEIRSYTTAVSRQRPVNSNREMVFSVQFVPRCYKS
jgi:hypothetical protein